MKPETTAAQALHTIDEATGSVVPPIYLATTYARDASYATRGPSYARDDNPTPVVAERVIAALEGGAAALAFSSGMAAATAAIRAACKPGDHVVSPRIGYYALRAWLDRFSSRWGISHEPVDTTDLAAVRRAVRPGTRIVWIEAPSNPTWEVADIAAIAEIALGADLVMHAATKYLAGHSDVLAGALVTARVDDHWAQIRELRHDEGPCLGPLEAYLLARGMRTLFARVERSSRTAQFLAEQLAARGVTVRYPGLPSHPQHAVAARQMRRGFGSMLSIQVGGGAERALAIIKRLRVWVPATSLGGVESLVEHRHTIEGPTTPTPPDLLRLSVGLEHESDLLEDLLAALG